MSRKSIVVAFADKSLGGTARSALESGKGWKLEGYEVVFLAVEGVHQQRLKEFASVGRIVGNASQVDGSKLAGVHLHHGLFDLNGRRRWGPLLKAGQNWSSVPMIANNVFGSPNRFLKAWPGPLLTTVLGHWAARQYKAVHPRSLGEPQVVPNPQDFDFFRPPSQLERKLARDRLGLDDKVIILRVGSPLKGKWSRAYLRLARHLGPRFHLLTVGTPAALRDLLSENAYCTHLDITGDSNALRDLYWASDAFALSARQGESFGNVIMEALGCGLPVIYQHRPFRDNTPWDFRHIPGFYLVRGDARWAEACLDGRGPTAQGSWQDPFALSSVAELLGKQLVAMSAGSELPRTTWPASPISRGDNLRLLVRHNPVMSLGVDMFRTMKACFKR